MPPLLLLPPLPIIVPGPTYPDILVASQFADASILTPNYTYLYPFPGPLSGTSCRRPTFSILLFASAAPFTHCCCNPSRRPTHNSRPVSEIKTGVGIELSASSTHLPRLSSRPFPTSTSGTTPFASPHFALFNTHSLQH
ncbi:unnamed protein product [Alternaria burnsii]|nr:unnamed protein product [Alternaria burnsii]